MADNILNQNQDKDEKKDRLTQDQIDNDIQAIVQQGGGDNDIKSYLTQQNISFEEPKQRRTVEDISRGLFGESQAGQIAERAVVDAVIAPLTEVGRGLINASAGFYETLDSATKLVTSITGGKGRGGAFGQWSSDLRRYAETELPPTKIIPSIKTIYEIVGGSLPIVTEFAIAEKALVATGIPAKLSTAGLGELTETGKFALLGALDEYEKSGEYRSLGEGAKKGAILQMSFGIASRGLLLFQKFGKKVAEKWVAFTTGDPKLAKAFVANPRKFNLNPKNKLRTSKEVKAENDLRKRDLQQKFQREKTFLQDNVRKEKELLKDKLVEKKQNLDASFQKSKVALQDKSRIRLEEASDDAGKAIQDYNQTIERRIVKTYDEALDKFKIVKRTAGENVNLAIETTLKENPMASIPYKVVNEKFSKVLKRAPFNISERGITPGRDQQGLAELAAKQGIFSRTKTVVSPRTAAASQSNATVFSKVLDEFRAKSKEGTVSIKYLQDLKGDLRTLSGKAFGTSNNELGIFYKDLANAANPADIVSGSKMLSKKLSRIAEANAVFNKTVPKYEEAMKQYFKRDAQGNFIPDINKAVNAVQKGDTVAIRQMRKADSVLPPEDRILPKINTLVNEMNTKAIQEKAIVRNLKRKAVQDKFKLDTAEKQALSNLNKQKTTLTREQRDGLEEQIRTSIRIKQNELNKTIDEFDSTLLFYQNVEKLGSTMAQGKLANIMQRASFYTTFGGAISGRLLDAIGAPGSLGVGALGATTVGLSPIAAKTTTKLADIIQRETNQLINSIPRAAKEVIGRRIQRALDSNK